MLWNFINSGADGYQPTAGVVFDASGNLYGTTLFGGAYNYGIVYELSPTASGVWKETIVHNFDRNGTDGFFPSTGKLVFDTQGNLYRATGDGGGGKYFQGTIDSILPSPYSFPLAFVASVMPSVKRASLSPRSILMVPSSYSTFDENPSTIFPVLRGTEGPEL